MSLAIALKAGDELDAYITAETKRRAAGPFDAKEVEYVAGCAIQKQVAKLMADALNKKDDAELGRLLRLAMQPHREAYHESEVIQECE